MIKLTDAAAAHIKKMIEQQSAAVGFRLSVKKSGCTGFAYVPEVIERVIEKDYVCSVGDINIYVDSACVDIFKGITLDFMNEGLGQTKLVFQNPNVKSECGCGESFSVDE